MGQKHFAPQWQIQLSIGRRQRANEHLSDRGEVLWYGLDCGVLAVAANEMHPDSHNEHDGTHLQDDERGTDLGNLYGAYLHEYTSRHIVTAHQYYRRAAGALHRSRPGPNFDAIL